MSSHHISVQTPFLSSVNSFAFLNKIHQKITEIEGLKREIYALTNEHECQIIFDCINRILEDDHTIKSTDKTIMMLKIIKHALSKGALTIEELNKIGLGWRD